MSHWLDKLGINSTCQLVAMCRGCIVLTRADDGTHTLWMYTHIMYQGDAVTARARYAQMLPDEWLRSLYR